jgi:hypothetical protein
MSEDLPEPEAPDEGPTRHVVPVDRIVERGRGCWNCTGFDLDGEVTMAAWNDDKAAHLAELLSIARGQPHPERFVKWLDRLAANPAGIHVELTDAPHVERAKRLVKMVDRMDHAVAQGAFRVCLRGGGADRGGKYLSVKYLCDKWCGRTGSSVATSGKPLDLLPDELRDLHK